MRIGQVVNYALHGVGANNLYYVLLILTIQRKSLLNYNYIGFPVKSTIYIQCVHHSY